LKLSPVDFWHSTPIEIHYALEDWYEVVEMQQQYLVRPLAEAFRSHGINYYNAQVKKQHRIKKSTDFIMYPWEYKEWLDKRQSLGQMREQLKAIAQAFGKKKKK
jgi:hypothetical protein